MDLSFTVAVVILRPESRGAHDHILLSQIRDSPNLEGQVPVFISLRNRVARLYPQALRSLVVASYHSQGYGGGIRPHLHCRVPKLLIRKRHYVLFLIPAFVVRVTKLYLGNCSEYDTYT
jgi:hypothetical protein